MRKYYFYSFFMIGLLGLNFGRSDFRAKNASSEAYKEKVEERLESAKSNAKSARENAAILEKVKVTAVSATSITVDNSGTSVVVNITDKTQLRRKFWGKSTLGEFSVNNIVSVIGKWTNDEKTSVDARVIRNLSIQKRYGVFFGEIKSINGDTFVMTSIHREDQTVTIGSAKLLNRREETINKADILVGHKVRVRGMWDSSNKTITEVREIKDFSLPPLPSRKPKTSPGP